MTKKTLETRGIHELYAEDPVAADKRLWDREADPLTRRGFLKRSSLLAMGAALGASIPFADKMPAGLIPAALAQSDEPFSITGKEGLVVLNDRPINAETPPHLLDDDITPGRHMFVRNNGLPPEQSSIDVDGWTLEVAGESCVNPATFSIAELKDKFDHHTYQLQVECGGNGRAEYTPSASGNQWTTGAVACPSFTGARLRDVLEACGIKDDAVYIGYYGADIHASGDANKEAISRGVPMEKALEDESLIAWAMNGEDIPYQNGHPLRLVCGGWPGSVSGKWLRRIVIRNQKHDGTKMAPPSYSVPKQPVAPGTDVPDEDMQTIHSMPVKSLITFPRSGITHALNEPLHVRGHAWAGDLSVENVQVSIDFGATWQHAELKEAPNRLAWQRFTATLEFPEPGYYEVWAKATDSEGVSQPMVVPGWNPKGYLNNACHRIAVQIA
ncbi:Mo-co oxidoreductase dimerisation domain-containing protein [Modicisalibacter ilicicola DSM 19980]|uniref:Mo-co oxidoreductase dimerisation domain-containing protein n=1 Tax=Modicisalibacter ilicicola DSM 19980 TaxID=1121942 RepID=A0A1M4X5W6_9GAMM|nr:sulfite oxidase [Halomonas ilicicola]SHE88773.1 Mo-co oxidoreductase dimerisation domain-containing protein [Halomonas ilicicola DSM 19980]